MSDLEDVILASVEDSQQTPDPEPTPDPIEDAPTEVPLEAPDAPEEPVPAEPEAQVPSPVESVPEVKPEAPKTEKKPSFDEKFGLVPTSPSGRENRIPYTRVKKIAEKAVRDAKKEWEAEHTPKFTEYETKVKDYETRLGRVAKFEDQLINQPEKHLEMLSNIPAYKHFFATVEAAIAHHQGQLANPQAPPAPVASDEMPQPDQDLSDGSKVYSMEGLKALMEWQAKQVETRITKQVEDRYKPLESSFEAQQQAQRQAEYDRQLLANIREEIAEAQTWDLFKENESEISKVMEANPKLSLAKAYRQVVFPKLKADRNRIREEVLKEVKQAPRSTAVSSGSTKPTPAASTGPRSLEDIITEQVKTLPRA